MINQEFTEEKINKILRIEIMQWLETWAMFTFTVRLLISFDKAVVVSRRFVLKFKLIPLGRDSFDNCASSISLQLEYHVRRMCLISEHVA